MNPTITKIAIVSIGVVAIGISAAVFALRTPSSEPTQALGAMVSAPTSTTVAVTDGGCSSSRATSCSSKKY